MAHYYLKQITDDKKPIIIHLTENEFIVWTNNAKPKFFPQMSENHAKFYKIDNIYIRDLFSIYGTYVNDVRIGSDTKPFAQEDIIGFGINSKSVE